ncbi:MAG: DUF2149 domain-containing protein [Oscillospiraceae bacterium]|nr:DUF2149 domain-containing protein [Oscillospiraceae bacterium]
MARKTRRLVTRKEREAESINPMAGLGNLSDIMLVFACGLMIAIILLWQVNLKDIVMIFDENNLVEVTDPDTVENMMNSLSDSDKIGSAYSDKSGKVFTLTEEDEDNQAGSASTENTAAP